MTEVKGAREGRSEGRRRKHVGGRVRRTEERQWHKGGIRRRRVKKSRAGAKEMERA